MKEHLRAVIWPRDPIDGPMGKIHRYVVVGMLVTDAPIPGVEGVNELFADGEVHGMSFNLEAVRKKQPAFPMGEASNVLCSLELLGGDP